MGWREALERRQVLAAAITGAATSIGINGGAVALNLYAISPIGHGGEVLLFVTIFPYMAFVFAVGTLLWGLALAPLSRTRRLGAALLAGSCAYVALGWPLLRESREVRHDGFERQAKRGDALVDAIRRYEARHGGPPPDLKALVPSFLRQVPRTGMAAYPEWRYDVGARATRWAKPSAPPEPWILYMDCSSATGWDTFLYFPSEQYPEEGYGGNIERIGRWAYVHE